MNKKMTIMALTMCFGLVAFAHHCGFWGGFTGGLVGGLLRPPVVVAPGCDNTCCDNTCCDNTCCDNSSQLFLWVLQQRVLPNLFWVLLLWEQLDLGRPSFRTQTPTSNVETASWWIPSWRTTSPSPP